MNSRIAERYALALMGIGKEKGSLDTFAKDMAMIAESLHTAADLRSMLHSPVIRPDIKLKVLHEIFKPRVSADTISFIDLLVRKGRAELLGSVTEEFQRLLDVNNQTINARIASATVLGEPERKQIVEKLHRLVGLTVRPVFEVDPRLRGGFTAKIGDTFIDASLQHQLENLREQWKHASLARVN